MYSMLIQRFIVCNFYLIFFTAALHFKQIHFENSVLIYFNFGKFRRYTTRDVIGCWEKNLNSERKERKHASSKTCEHEAQY